MGVLDIFRKDRRDGKVTVTVEQALKVIRDAFHAPTVKQQYDSLRFDPNRERVEMRRDYTETEQVFTGDRRLISYARADKLYDNDDLGGTVDMLVRMTVGNDNGNVSFIGDDADRMQSVFRRWKKNCGYQDNENLQEVLRLVLTAVIVHGDCVIYCDKDRTMSKIRVWDADQCVRVSESDFAKWCDANGGYDGDRDRDNQWRQVEGAVVDTTGRTRGWFVTAERNTLCVPLELATFLPAEDARLVKVPKKITQYRGESMLLPLMDMTDDTRELLKSQIAKEKLQAQFALVIRRDEDPISSMLAGMSKADLVNADTGLTDEQINDLTSASQKAQDFSAIEGKSALMYMRKSDEIANLTPNNMPSSNLQTWLDRQSDMNGKQLGVKSIISRGHTDISYSGGQLALAVSWMAIKEYQALLEDKVIDYCISRLFGDAEYEVKWNEAFALDPEKELKVREARLRLGLSTYRQELGSNWKRQIDQAAEEVAYFADKNLVHPQATTSSGAVIENAAEAVDPANDGMQTQEDEI